MAKQDVTVELFYNSVWNDHTSRVYTRDQIEISRGRSDQQGEPTPGTATLTFSNMSGDLVDDRYNPRNPESDLYGLIGRNTPIRITLGSSVRFVGEVASWKPRRAIKGDAWTLVTAKGVLHRLSQGDAPHSALWRAYTASQPIAYWPLEDGVDAEQAASGLPGGTPLTIQAGQIDFIDEGPTGSAGAAAMTLTTSGVITGPLPDSAGTAWQVAIWFKSQTADLSYNETTIFEVFTAATSNPIWQLLIASPASPGTSGTAQLSYRQLDGTLIDAIFNTGQSYPGLLDGAWHVAQFTLAQNGANVDAALYVDDTLIDSGTFAGLTLGKPTRVSGMSALDPLTDDIEYVHVSHIGVWDTATLVTGLYDAGLGNAGETVAARVERLCDEAGITFTLVGTAADTMAMGPQPVDTLVGLFAECERTDGGLLFETRTAQGITYRTRTDLYNQTPALALDFAAGEVAPPLEPDIDDLAVRNDITVANRGGSSARAVQQTGPLNIQAPSADPDGVGRYDTQYDVNVDDESVLVQIAGWQRHLGTDETTRYPAVTVDLDATPALVTDVDALDLGDAVSIDNLEADTVTQLVPGYGEVIGSHRRIVTLNAAPGRPWDVFELDSATLGRLDTDGSELTSDITTTATSLSVTVSSGPLWTTAAGEMPFDIRIGGEVMTVTAISGASSPQTFTVTRSTNGVVKAHAAGAPVNVATPVVLAL